MRRAAPVIKTVLGIFSFKADLHIADIGFSARYKAKNPSLPRAGSHYTDLSPDDAVEVISFKYM
jgi:hypothetical protein